MKIGLFSFIDLIWLNNFLKLISKRKRTFQLDTLLFKENQNTSFEQNNIAV